MNHASVAELRKDADGRVSGARVVADGDEVEVRARCVVNAAGVWADDVRALDEGAHPSSIRPAKGVHVTLPWSKIRNDIAAIVPVRADRRSVFVVPWGDFTYVGTTDTDYDGPIDDPQCDASDIEYLLGALNGVLEEPVTTDDVVGTWAGLRPLLRTASSARTADLSRRHGVRVSDSGVITITGGKLTTYRRMAADTVDQVERRLGTGHTRSRTKKLPLLGGDGYEAAAPSNEPSLHEHLGGRYGTEADAVLALVDDDPDARRATRAGAAVRARRGRVRRARGDGPHARRRALAPHPCPPPRPRSLRGRGAGGRRADRTRARLGPGRRRASGRVLPRARRRGAGRVARARTRARVRRRVPGQPVA